MASLFARVNRSITSRIMQMRAEPRGPSVFEFPTLLNSHYYLLFNIAGILGLGFYSGVLVTATRKSTFYRNRAVIEEKYGPIHRESFGQDSKLNRFGYPDMGNNLYADLLPYKDWLRINNA